MANTEEGEWLEGLDPQSQQEDYARFIAQKATLYDFGYMLGLGDAERLLQDVLNKIFTYDPETDTFRTHAEYYSGPMIRRWVQDARKEKPF